jgi:hypothetical protein
MNNVHPQCIRDGNGNDNIGPWCVGDGDDDSDDIGRYAGNGDNGSNDVDWHVGGGNNSSNNGGDDVDWCGGKRLVMMRHRPRSSRSLGQTLMKVVHGVRLIRSVIESARRIGATHRKVEMVVVEKQEDETSVTERRVGY